MTQTRAQMRAELTRKAMMDADSWPHLSLPMKRWKNGNLECAALANPVRATEPVTLYIGNIFIGDFSEDKAHNYASIDACIADGWEVD